MGEDFEAAHACAMSDLLFNETPLNLDIFVKRETYRGLFDRF